MITPPIRTMILDTSYAVGLREEEVQGVWSLLTTTPTHWRELIPKIQGKSERNRHKRLCAATAELRARGVPVCNQQEGYYLGSREEALAHVNRSISQEEKALRTHRMQLDALREGGGGNSPGSPVGPSPSSGPSGQGVSIPDVRHHEQQGAGLGRNTDNTEDAPPGCLFDNRLLPSQRDASRL